MIRTYSLLFDSKEAQRKSIKKFQTILFPEFKTGGAYYKNLLDQYITPESVVLDAGCGDGGILSELKNIPKRIIGIDQSKAILEKNTICHEKILSDLNALPISDASIDVVVCQFVLEHLKTPLAVFREIARVLKPGGVFMFITPNLWNPVMMASKALPHSLHTYLRERLLHVEEETHPTFYRANTMKQLIKLGRDSNLSLKQLSRAGNPEYLAFARPFVCPAILLERLLNVRPFCFMKMYLIGAFMKEK